MQLEFVCICNGNYPFVNGAIFEVGGERIMIDRDTTEYTWYPDEEKMTMRWKGAYVWDGVSENYEIPEILRIATLIGLEVEDDAPEWYRCECVECYVDGQKVEIAGTPTLYGFLFRHGKNDIELWEHDLPEYVVEEIMEILSDYVHTGCSIRGTAESIAEEIKEVK